MNNQNSRHEDVGRICSGQVISIDVGDSLLEAAQRMTYKRVGALTVLDRGTLVGIISEADLVAAIVEHVPFATTCLRAYMTEAPITVSASDEADLAARYMLEHEIGHLPVMESGEPIGMLSRGDLLAVGATPEPHGGGAADGQTG
jgi:CBS domain-containing protein